METLERSLLTGLGYIEVEAFASLDVETPKVAEKVAALQAQLADAEARRKRLLALAETGDDAAAERFAAVAAEVRTTKKALEAAEAEASKVASDPGLVQRLTDAAVLSRQIEDGDPERRRELRIRLSELLRSLIERVECRPDMGAVMILKPRLGPRWIEGVAPFAFQRSAEGVWSTLIEPDADDESLNAFLGVSTADWGEMLT